MSSVDRQSLQHRRHTPGATLLTALLVAAWLVASGVLGGAAPGSSLTTSGSAPPTPVVPVASTSYVVQPGDTLWSVARRLRPKGDVRPLVDHLGRQTGGRPLRAGQRIPLP
ncbi:MAG: LysM peptidoglycan-binding domain-containing protein [Actinomycetota bacterium]|jgi:LysM repeat protein|nr:LysM peptidoglycan-binding domain-containing protein [Actinomycetota bacterium]PLS75374.1 MAG: hypothetical protein CYG61_07665 [Actinomycetota bacterium]